MYQTFASLLRKPDIRHVILEGDDDRQGRNNISVDTSFIDQSENQSDKVEIMPIEEQHQHVLANENTICYISPKQARGVMPRDGDEIEAQADSDDDYDMKSVDTYDYNSSSESSTGDVEDNEAKNAHIIQGDLMLTLLRKASNVESPFWSR